MTVSSSDSQPLDKLQGRIDDILVNRPADNVDNCMADAREELNA